MIPVTSVICSIVSPNPFAFLGSIIDEFIFIPLATRNKELYEENKEVDTEYDKEMRRIKARQKVKEDLDGSV